MEGQFPDFGHFGIPRENLVFLSNDRRNLESGGKKDVERVSEAEGNSRAAEPEHQGQRWPMRCSPHTPASPTKELSLRIRLSSSLS